MSSRIKACPAAPNCVSSDATDAIHRASSLVLLQPTDRAWPLVRDVVAGLARTRVIQFTGDYLRAECRSAAFRFVDDLELELRPAAGVIAVRSASRVGYFDFGVNRRRVEHLREVLRSRGVIR